MNYNGLIVKAGRKISDAEAFKESLCCGMERNHILIAFDIQALVVRVLCGVEGTGIVVNREVIVVNLIEELSNDFVGSILVADYAVNNAEGKCRLVNAVIHAGRDFSADVVGVFGENLIEGFFCLGKNADRRGGGGWRCR